MMGEDTHTTGGIPEAGEVIADRYLVEDILGTGGMSMLVGARHIGLGQPVAIKFLFPEMASRADIVARFLREARAMATIRGDHVPRVYDVANLPNGAPYIVMERLRGDDLEKIAKARGPLPIAEAVGWVIEACEGVAEAHAHGIVHRDLKTANLFLAERDSGGTVVKVLDFGISKMSEASVAITGNATTLGSPAFISPEQIRSTKTVDHRTDIWALGVILYRLLSGAYPFEGKRVSDTLGQVMTADPRPLRALRPEMPEALEAAIFRCLEKELDKRTNDVADLVLSISPFAPPESRASVERIWRTLRGTSPPVPAPPPTAGPKPSITVPMPATNSVARRVSESTEVMAKPTLRALTIPLAQHAPSMPVGPSVPVVASAARVPVVQGVSVAVPSVKGVQSVPASRRGLWLSISGVALAATVILVGLGVSRAPASPRVPAATASVSLPPAPSPPASSSATQAALPVPDRAPEPLPEPSVMASSSASAQPAEPSARPTPIKHAPPPTKKRSGSYLDKW